MKRSRMKPAKRSAAETKWSRDVRERDNFTCQFPGCNKSGRSIDTHHISPRSLRPDLKFVLSNGVSLDREHHQWVHANREKAIAMGLLNLESYELANEGKAGSVNGND